jgi:tetratricopeptide (TPR) repeat protein
MRTVLAVAAAAVALTAGAAIAIPRHAPATPPPPSRVVSSTVDPLVTAQEHLRRVPGDWTSWAELGLAYVERARVTADPAWYRQAEGALATSAKLRPGNVEALVGMGALANARHEFAQARDLARQAIKTDSYSSAAWGVLADAYTQLGKASEATDAVQKMLDLRPGLSAYSRAAYDLEQHGRVAEARDVWNLVIVDTHSPADVAYVQVQLGDLAWHTGDRTTARDHYNHALAADPASLPARAGLARVSGDLALWGQITAAFPSPSLLIEYATQLRSFGHSSSASDQLDLAAAALALFGQSGGQDDLGLAELAIARGSYKDAVAFAQREYARRQHADVTAVLAWALYLSGDARSALPLARQSVALGTQNAVARLHLRIITEELGLSPSRAAVEGAAS